MSEVIVDGVDVSGCPEYCKYREGYCGWHVPCDVEGSCQYKINWLKQQVEAYKQSEQEAGEIIAELKHENEQLKDVACDAIIEQERLIKQVNAYRTALEETRKILSISELPPVDEDNLMTATELMVEVSLKREEKLNKIQDKVDEVLK